MFRNYLMTALRNIARHRLYSFINITGLAVGLACAIFIMLFVRDELSYDKWVPGAENLYRLELTAIIPGRPPLAMAVIPYPMPAAMKDEIPEVTAQTRLWPTRMTLTVGDRQFLEKVDFVDPGFFQMIRLPLIAGDPAQVFRQPDSAVLAQSVARKYFGSADPIGRVLTTSRGQCAEDDLSCKASTISLKVTGIARDLPHNSQMMGEIFVSNASGADRYSQKMKADWFSENGYGYVALAPGADPQTVIAKMAPVFNKALNGILRKFGIPLTGEKAYLLHLTPFAQVHLNSSRWSFNMVPPGSWATVYGVAAIGVLILLVACFNFMNLATARALLRAREIALRKTLGASRRQLILQFLGESVLMAVLALLVALALVEILLPAFGRFLERPITLHYVADWPLMLMILAVSVAAGLISGSYPALVLSGFRPAIVLRTNSSGQAGSGRLRTTLVVLQFAVSIGLGIAAMVVFAQISYARSIDLGFRRDNVLAVSGGMLTVNGGGRTTAEGRNGFVQTLRANPGILDIAMSNYTPFDNGQSLTNVVVPGQPDMIALNEIIISPNFPSFYGMRLLAGRLLSDSRAEDKLYRSAVPLTADPRNGGHNILVNESAAARMGYTPQQAVGKTILFGNSHVHIVGVLADIKFGGAREPIKPTAYTYYPQASVGLVLRLKPDVIPQTIAFIDKTWRRFAPQTAVQRTFLDESFEKLYRADERQGTMFGIFVAIAIAIACLGLFGLAAFTAERRTKEIGVRKVFGARTRDVVFLLLWQFSIPVLIANLIAWPLAWYYLHGWLQGFAYRIPLNPLYFIGAGLVALLIAWATIFAHARRVAGANPINALRYE
jgi:putative ABC transport system permease protein